MLKFKRTTYLTLEFNQRSRVIDGHLKAERPVILAWFLLKFRCVRLPSLHGVSRVTLQRSMDIPAALLRVAGTRPLFAVPFFLLRPQHLPGSCHLVFCIHRRPLLAYSPTSSSYSLALLHWSRAGVASIQSSILSSGS